MKPSGQFLVLTRAADRRAAVRELLQDSKDERFVCVAFVGRDGCEYLPKPRGIRLYCWPLPGATDPYGVEALLRSGVEVTFVDRLHCKVYWSRKKGALIGSANLSFNGFSDEGLTEAMVRLRANTWDAETFFRTLKQIPEKFEDKLEWLHREHVKFQQRNPKPGKHKVALSFGEWYRNQRPNCVLAGYTETCEAPIDSLENLAAKTGSTAHATFYASAHKRRLNPGLFTLSFRTVKNPNGLAMLSGHHWWAPEIATESSLEGWRDCRYVFFAKRFLPKNTQAPFNCREKRFRTALQNTVDTMPDEIWDDVYKPTSQFWTKVNQNYLRLE